MAETLLEISRRDLVIPKLLRFVLLVAVVVAVVCAVDVIGAMTVVAT